ncbi:MULTISPECIES: hypothetical protein [Citrobacter freundii complex]|uniref:hypothetical protein n=1 Tax=Citrobacter freundii TaxID=546 RepID=UPI0028BEDE6B|nr:hypothetical protein [Citrobacter freundii]MDT7446321.1 hypothetical protein [Citrobacter freundii]
MNREQDNLVLLKFGDKPRNGGNGGDGMSEQLEKRIEKLEGEVSSIQKDIAVLTARSEQFSTKAEVERLRGDLIKEINSVNTKITWSIFIPLMVAALGWLAKQFFFV